MSTKQMGKVVQCIGAVVDVEFPRDQMPKVYDALIIEDKDSNAEEGLTLEVQQQLGMVLLELLLWDLLMAYQEAQNLLQLAHRFKFQLVRVL